MGESTINLPPGSVDLSLYILYSGYNPGPPFIFNKMQAFHSEAIDGDLYSEVHIPTFPHLTPYNTGIMWQWGFTLITKMPHTYNEC